LGSKDVAGFIGGFGLRGVGQQPSALYASIVPLLAFVIFQAMFAIITAALINRRCCRIDEVRGAPGILIAVIDDGLHPRDTLGMEPRWLASTIECP
jgi:hypothetical protein